MTKFKVPTREQVTPENQAIFDNLNSQLGFVPNIYATYAFSKDALGRYMSFAGGKTSLNAKEKEVINLVVSQVNGCTYCLAAHTAIGKMNGFTDEQILELRKGGASFDSKLDALVKLSKTIIENRGNVDDTTLDAFFNAGYDKGSLVDVILAVGEKTIANFLHKVTDVPVDFPEAPGLS
ncbi:MAG: carboxymuconolactone decarboxylase family protein [Bacteroidetes bacterium]|nr:MAG: carboxymuconolactone decarboxylase family protein [Bacteroidota bacterium]